MKTAQESWKSKFSLGFLLNTSISLALLCVFFLCEECADKLYGNEKWYKKGKKNRSNHYPCAGYLTI